MENDLKWSVEKIRTGFQRFYQENQRYPTANEIDACDYLPSSRQLQRRFIGGLPALRKKLGLSGPQDFTKGLHSSNRAQMINKRAHQLEKEVYDYLVGQFGKVCVHREYLFTDDARTRTDFFVYDKNQGFSVDVFYPKDRHNLIGCLNSKLKTYSKITKSDYPVIFLMMNTQITREEIAQLISNKKNKLKSYQRIMTLVDFKQFCRKREALAP